MTNEVTLITGASSGIGWELAQLFAADKYDLVLVARSESKLQTLADQLRQKHGVAVRVLVKDLTASQAPLEMYQELKAADVHVDTLVNNAGFGAWGAVAGLDLERQLNMIQINVAALTCLTRLFLPGMLARARGGILNVGSTAAFQPGPNMAVYYATKAYVLSFTEALAEEVKSRGIIVTCLAPGPTKTGFGAEAGMGNPLLVRAGTMTARDVAKAGYDALRRGKPLVVPGIRNKLGVFSVRLSPRWVVRKMVHKRVRKGVRKLVRKLVNYLQS
jgi:Short-chain dehydrogenases of various substrate specificities